MPPRRRSRSGTPEPAGIKRHKPNSPPGDSNADSKRNKKFITMGGDFIGHGYKTRSQGTSNYVDTSLSAMPQHRVLNKPGVLSATWVHDLFSRARLFPCDSGTPHELRIISTQSSPEFSGTLVCICIRCKKTVNFHIPPPAECCHIKDNRVHHLVLRDQSTKTISLEFHDILSTATFQCSVVDCQLTILVQVCARRFPLEWETMLLDRNAVLERLKRLVEEDPIRFGKLMLEETQARLYPAFYLQLYIRDALTKGLSENGKPTKVSARNKFYAAVFGDGFDLVFRRMGFEQVTEEGEQFIQLPLVDSLAPSTPCTPLSVKKGLPGDHQKSPLLSVDPGIFVTW